MATSLGNSDSEEEVRKKPNRHNVSGMELREPNPQLVRGRSRLDETEEETNPSSPPQETYDILLIGHTGYGKSSTADKLMVPNFQEPPIPGEASAICPSSEATVVLQNVSANHHKDDCTDENEDEPVKWKNLTGWVLSADEQESINTETRLKNIVFCRETRRDCEPHIHIDRLRSDPAYENIYSSTKSCQLITNDDSKIRVLDAPGFFSPDLMEGATNKQESNLAIVRHIVRIQAIADLKFKRVLYFLPVRGKLDRADGTINTELQELIKFFGASVLKNMVLVAITVKNLSKQPSLPSEEKFSRQDLTESQTNFNIALRDECQRCGVNTEDLPPPPIIFIAMTDTCEEILHKIKQAPVHDETGLQLVFNPRHCIKCGMEVAIKDGEKLMCEYRATGALKWSEAIAYNDSYCHPQMVPVYTVKSIFKGIGKLLQYGRWHFTEEKCINPECKKGPGSKGCKKVGSNLNSENAKQDYQQTDRNTVVDHTYTLDD